MSGTNYDVIVIGVGSMGVSSCYFLAERGYKVLGIDQFVIPHDQGSHAGQSRIIRKAYFEHPDYVPLLKRAYENWQALEKKTGEQLYFKTGLLYQGPADHPMIKGVKDAALLYGIEAEQLTPQKSLAVFPQFVVPGNFEVIHEPDVVSVIATDILETGAEVLASGEMLLEPGEAASHGMASRIDDLGVGQDGRDQPYVLEIIGHLIDEERAGGSTLNSRGG